MFPFYLQGKVYLFDRVIKPNSSQEKVYEIVAKDIVKGKPSNADIVALLEQDGIFSLSLFLLYQFQYLFIC